VLVRDRPFIQALAILVRRLLDGKASPEEEQARPILEWTQKGWPRAIKSAHSRLLDGDHREADRFLRLALEIAPDAATREGFYTVTRQRAWRRLNWFEIASPPAPPRGWWRYLTRAVSREARTARLRWKLDHLPLPSAKPRQRKAVAEAQRIAEDALARKMAEEKAQRLDHVVERLKDRQELAVILSRARLSPRQTALVRKVLDDGLAVVDALDELGERMPLWTSTVQKLRRAV
jgi:hypothetical protein